MLSTPWYGMHGVNSQFTPILVCNPCFVFNSVPMYTNVHPCQGGLWGLKTLSSGSRVAPALREQWHYLLWTESKTESAWRKAQKLSSKLCSSTWQLTWQKLFQSSSKWWKSALTVWDHKWKTWQLQRSIDIWYLYNLPFQVSVLLFVLFFVVMVTPPQHMAYMGTWYHSVLRHHLQVKLEGTE